MDFSLMTNLHLEKHQVYVVVILGANVPKPEFGIGGEFGPVIGGGVN